MMLLPFLVALLSGSYSSQPHSLGQLGSHVCLLPNSRSTTEELGVLRMSVYLGILNWLTFGILSACHVSTSWVGFSELLFGPGATLRVGRASITLPIPCTQSLPTGMEGRTQWGLFLSHFEWEI